MFDVWPLLDSHSDFMRSSTNSYMTSETVMIELVRDLTLSLTKFYTIFCVLIPVLKDDASEY